MLTTPMMIFILLTLIIPLLLMLGEFTNNKKTRIVALVMLIIFLLFSGVSFISATIYSNYNHEHYARGFIRIGEMLNNGQLEEAKRAIERFKEQRPKPELFSLDSSLFINKAIDDEIKKK